jgi:hypothetical protein
MKHANDAIARGSARTERCSACPSSLISATTMHSLLALLTLALTARAAPGQAPLTLDTRVPVVLGVMSACPDALACEAVFDDVLPRVAPKIALALEYIAQCVPPPAPSHAQAHRPGRTRRTRRTG